MTDKADLLIRGATVVDGSGLPAYTADIEVRGGKISRVGRLPGERAERVIQADGLHVTPGFVDVHTHYEPQLHFEPTASPSSWHGVTTVLTGNCGFSIAPSKAEDLEWLTLMLAKVEGMSVDALRAGVNFPGGSVADFLANLEGRIGVNMAYYVAHSAVRRWVMGKDASERMATAAEVEAMKVLVDQGMKDGAIGFSTSQLDVHADHDGRPIPSNLASASELVALTSVLANYREGVVEHLCRSFATGYDESDRNLLRDMAIASGGKILHVNMLLRFTTDPDIWKTCLEVLEGYANEGLRVYPMASANPKGLHLALTDTGMLDEMPTFRAVLSGSVAERSQKLREASVRVALSQEFDDPTLRQVKFGWNQLLVAGVELAQNRHLLGRSVADIAQESGAREIDAFLDLALAEELKTVFVIDRPVTQDDRDVIAFLLRHPQTTPGSSDGGAHINTFCGADYTTRILTEYVGEGGLSFEEAVRKLSAIPAMTACLWDRGVIRPGAAADLLIIEREKLGVGAVRAVDDLPTGASRLVIDQQGYRATIVNGETVIEDGRATGSLPGSVLRFNQ
jgi:N-acyl-D-aspartate/D-glutamate deacylase